MKLGITSNIYLPFSCGVSNVIKETVNFLINKHNYDITIFTPNWLNSSSKEDQRNLHICRFPYKHIIQNYAISPKLFNSLKKQKFDIIHSHGFGYFPAFAGFLASKLNNTPHLLTPHYHPPIYGLFRKSLFWLYNLTQGLPMLRFSEKILPITEYEKKLLCNIGGTPKNMQISPNMINTNLIKFSNKILPIKTKEKIILRIGKFSREKGGDIAFNIAKNIVKNRNDISFIFVGSGGEFEVDIKRQAAKFDKNTFIFLDKGISTEELVNLYSVADVVISTSIYEAFCIVLAEAMSCKTPVVATKVGGVPDVVTDTKSGFLVEYGNWKKFEEKICLLLDDMKLNRKFGRYGRKYVVENFEREKILNNLINIYESILNSKNEIYK